MPKISFIIPTLNEERVIEKLLRNLREITAVDYEIIVSDGKSTDRTVEIAKQLADKIAENASGRRQTIGEGRNEGAKLATGDILIFLDADVHVPKPNEFFRRVLGHFERDPKLYGLSGWIRVFPETESFMDIIGYLVLSDWAFYVMNNWFGVGSTCGELQIIKAEIFRKLGGYREDLAAAEDKDLFYRVSRLGHTRTDPKLLIYHTGRRPHAIGWPKMLFIWTHDQIHLVLFGKPHSKEWKVIR